MAKGTPLTDEDLISAIFAAEANAMGGDADSVSSDRADAIDRYLGRDYTGDLAAPPGRSSVVSRDVADVVEGVLANVLKPFVGSERIAQFDPLGPDDEDAAEQESDYVNYVLLQRNNGFLTLNAAVKDALLLRTGYIKCGWAVRRDIISEQYSGLGDEELAMLVQDKDVEIVQHSEYPDPLFAGQMAPGQPPAPLPMLHDVKIRRVRPTEYVETIAAPPDEIRVSKRSRGPSLQQCDFVQHQTHLTLSELREMGYTVDDYISDLGDAEDIEDIARTRFGAKGAMWNDDTTDQARRVVLYKETWLRIDRDGDGIAELLKVCSVGNTLFSAEEADIIPIASGTGILMAHQHMGLSVYDLVQDIARLKTALMRQYMDNKYLANNPQTYVNMNLVNMDDMLISRPGGIRRVDGDPNTAVMERAYPDTGASALQGLEYLDSVRENRTGYTRQSQGLETDALVNKTVGAMQMQLSQSQLRLEMIARTVAETLIRDLFLITHALTLKHSTREEKVRLNAKWVAINPREWVRRTDLSLSVGIGSSSQQTMMGQLMIIAQAQEKSAPLGLVTPSNVYALDRKLVNTAGFKNADEFFTAPPLGPDGKPAPTPPPPPPPQVQVEQIKQQAAEQDRQQAAQFKQQELAAQQEVQRSNDQRDAERTQLEMALKERQMMEELRLKDVQHQREQETKVQLEVQLANIKAASAAQVARIGAGIDDGWSLMVQQEREAGYSAVAQALQTLHAAITGPKKITRAPDGSMVVQHLAPPTVQ
jgi:hypothetical protein